MEISPERRRIARALESLQVRVETFLRVSLLIVFTAAAVGGFFVVRRWPELLLYYAIGILFFVMYAIGTIVGLVQLNRRREPRPADGLGVPPASPTGAIPWAAVLWGRGPRAGGSGKSPAAPGGSMEATSLPEGDRPERAALPAAQELRRQGLDLDHISAAVQPAYTGWDEQRRRSFREHLTRLLDEMQRSGKLPRG